MMVITFVHPPEVSSLGPTAPANAGAVSFSSRCVQVGATDAPYPSTIVNRGALPESWFFWRRWRRPKPA